MINRILVPVDFSKPSLEALDYAIEFALPLEAKVVLLHVVEPFYFGGPDALYGVGFDANAIYGDLERAARQQLLDLVTTLRSRHVDVSPLIAFGAASQVIADTAEKLTADMVIMATHGRTGLSHILVGSVAERVVRTAPCPVLTMRSAKPATRQTVGEPIRRSNQIARPAQRRARRGARATAENPQGRGDIAQLTKAANNALNGRATIRQR